MSTRMIYAGDLAILPDGAAADLVRNPSQLRDALDEKIGGDVPALVDQRLAEQPAVVAAAANAVSTEVAARDLLEGGDPRALPADALSYFGPLPAATGYTWGIVLNRNGQNYVALGVRLDASVAGRFSVAAQAGVAANVVPDCIQEWWIGPIAQRFPGWVATCGLGNKGQVLAVDLNDRTAPVAVQVGVAPTNDHNVPARFTLPGRGSIMQWSHHGTSTDIYMVVAPGTGRAETFTGRPVQAIAIGSAASYGQILHLAHLQTSSTDTFRILIRNDLNWGAQDVVVDWALGTVTKTGAFRRLVSFTEQPYMTTVPAAFDANGNVTKVRIGVGFNPAAGRDDVFLLEMDLTTGILHDKANPSVTHDTASGSYLAWTALTPVLANKPTGTRRLFGISPVTAGEVWKILTCEYAGAVGADGVYMEYTFNVVSMTITGSRNLGVAGKHFERYPAGAQFDRDGAVWMVRETGNVYTLYHENTPVRRSTLPMVRPIPVYAAGPIASLDPGNIDVLVAEVATYLDFLTWSGAKLIGVKKEALV